MNLQDVSSLPFSSLSTEELTALQAHCWSVVLQRPACPRWLTNTCILIPEHPLLCRPLSGDNAHFNAGVSQELVEAGSASRV